MNDEYKEYLVDLVATFVVHLKNEHWQPGRVIDFGLKVTEEQITLVVYGTKNEPKEPSKPQSSDKGLN